MYCKKCGKEIESEWTICPSCGEQVNKEQGAINVSEKKKKKKPIFKRWWFIVIVVVFIGIIIVNTGDSSDSETSNKTIESNNTNQQESAASDNYTVSSLYETLQDNEVAPYILSEKAKQFLSEHADYFPATNYEHIAGIVDTSIEYRYVEKNPSEYGDKLMELPELYVLSITEDDIGTSDKFTEIQAMDAQDNVYRIFYNGELKEVYKEDIIKADVLPLGVTSYDNVSGGTTNALVVAGAYLNKIDSAVE